MRLKRRIIAFLLVAVTMIGWMIPASAAQSASVSITSGTVQAGKTVELTVSISDNPGIAAALFYLYYDTTAFTLDVDRDITATGAFTAGGVIGNTIQIAKASGSYRGEAAADGALALWYNLTGSDVTANGQMLKIRLTALEDAANGAHTIRLGYSAMDTCNSQGQLVPMQLGQASLTITGGSDEKKPGVVIEAMPQFTDVSGHWAESWIWQAAGLGLIEGYQGKYRADDTMTRAEFVTILWRAQGEPAPSGKASFRDLTQDWYRDAVAWAEEKQVVNGMGDGLFAPNASVTREQLVTILHRLAGTPMGMEMMLTGTYDSQYPDSNQISAWAKPALYWSVYKGIYCGEHSAQIGQQLSPKANANRAQIAVMMVRYLDKNTEKEGTT